MINNFFGIPVLNKTKNKTSQDKIIFDDLSRYIYYITEQDFNQLLEKSGLSEENFIEFLVSEGWKIGLDSD